MANTDLYRSFSAGLGQDIVTVEVGEAKEKFNIHRDLICDMSPYFKTAFSGNFRESEEKVLPLPNLEVTIFKAFLDWLYFRKALEEEEEEERGDCFNCGDHCEGPVPTKEQEKLLGTIPPDEDIHLEALIKARQRQKSFVNMYIFADMYDVPQLRQDIVDATWRAFKLNEWVACYMDIIIVCRQVPSRSSFYKLLVDISVDAQDCYTDFDCPVETRLGQKVSSEFLYRIMVGHKIKLEIGQASMVKPLCEYHEHDQDNATVSACDEKRQKLKESADREYEVLYEAQYVDREVNNEDEDGV